MYFRSYATEFLITVFPKAECLSARLSYCASRQRSEEEAEKKMRWSSSTCQQHKVSSRDMLL